MYYNINEKMIRIVLVIILGLVVSCKTSKNTGTETKPKENIPEVTEDVSKPEETPSTDGATSDPYYLGEVKMKACGIVIQINGRNGMQVTCNPKNLESRFRIDGLRIKLKFKEIPRLDSGCSSNIAIEITDMFPVR